MSLKIKNWERFQHYKDRPDVKRLTWVRLHCEVVNDFEFAALSDHLAIVLVLLWAVGAKDDGAIPEDPARLSFLLRRQVTLGDLKSLVSHGFLIDEDGSLENSTEPLENCGVKRSSSIPEERREEERREEGWRDASPTPRPAKSKKVVITSEMPMPEDFSNLANAAGLTQEETRIDFLKWRTHHCGETIDPTRAWRNWIKRSATYKAERKKLPATGDDFSPTLIAEWQRDPLSGAEVRTKAEAIRLLREDQTRASQ